MALLHWDKDKEKICSAIADRKNSVNVLLKTKDDPEMLQAWITHHSAMVGTTALIIADNGSTSAEVHQIYRAHSKSMILFQFSGFHNFIHSRSAFCDLYDALARSAPHYIILDTDERLTATDGKAHGKQVLRKVLSQLDPAFCYPAPWLHNLPGSKSMFPVPNAQEFRINLLYGKPIMSARPRLDLSSHEAVLHNAQAPRHVFGDRKPAGLFVLHLSNYSSTQRIKANRQKLKARGIPVDDFTDEQLCQVDFSKNSDFTVPRLAREIQTHLRNPITPHSDEITPPGVVHFTKNGSVLFGSEESRKLFFDQLNAFSTTADSLIGLFSERDWTLGVENEAELRARVNEARSARDCERLKLLLNYGLVEFPRVLDTYGHPTYRKELIRTLLNEGKFEEAEGFYPIAGSPAGSAWHEVLLARALDLHGFSERGTNVWRRVLAREPGNGEAKYRLEQ